jgi:hypothetical protein
VATTHKAADLRPGSRPARELSGRVIDHQLHQLRDLLSCEIARVRNVGFGIWGIHKGNALGGSAGPQRVTTMLPNAEVMTVGAPPPILKETPTNELVAQAPAKPVGGGR